METRNTLQKKVIYDIFKTFTNHPTVDMVYEKTHEEYPSISKATVYRVLNQLSEDGTIQKVKVLGAADRYDFNLSKHNHLLCDECNMVYDIDVSVPVDLSNIQSNSFGFKIKSAHVCFIGICPKCLSKEKN